MIYASIIVEAVRARPSLVFWLAALVQAVLWLIVPALFYSAPPGGLADVLAIGHEMRLGTTFGPPLAFWLAEIAFNLAGGLLGVYLLSQLCVVVTLWSLWALGRDIVGVRQSVLAVLLLAGMSTANVVTPDFGPSILAMPLWSLTLLHSWRAIGLKRQSSWFALSLAIGLLLLTTYLGLLLVLLLDLFLLGSKRGRASLLTPGPWLCTVMVAIIVLPYGAWLSQQQDILDRALSLLREADPARDTLLWLRMLAGLLTAHSGLIVLTALASGWPFERKRRAPTVDRTRDDRLGNAYVVSLAIVPALAATALLAIAHIPVRLVLAAPLLVLSGLAVIVLAGARIPLRRQRILGYAWAILLCAPPAIIALAVATVPRLLPIELRVAQPAAALGTFFSETFARRTGHSLAIVAGEQRLASLIAVSSDSRPRLFIDDKATPWLTQDDIRRYGAVVVWPATDTPGTPPADIKARFPKLVLEVPRTFERSLQGFGPPLRVGWAVIRPMIRPLIRPLGEAQ